MNHFLLSLAALLVVALAAAFAVPYFVEWTAYRQVFEAQTSRMLGRPVKVGGDVSLRLLPVPQLRFKNVQVADAQGRFEAPFAKADSFTILLSVPPLLRGEIEAREIKLEQPSLNLVAHPDGSGNWYDIGRSGTGLPFTPTTVALESVQIVNGSITLRNGAEGRALALRNVNGELSARSLEGPFKFAGAFESDGRPWQLRFSTGRSEPEGGYRLKALLHDADWQQSYALDGIVSGFSQRPDFAGRAVVRLAPEGGRLSEDSKAAAAHDDAVFEMKADLRGGLNVAELEAIDATWRRQGRPYTINGRLKADWQSSLVVDADLSTRWFDFDALISAQDAGSPAAALAALASELLRHAEPVRDGSLRLAVEQAGLAGDVIKNFQLAVRRGDQGLRIDRLSGEAPGENQVVLSGELALRESPAFTGRAQVEGKRLTRLLRWLGASAVTLAGSEAGDYRLDAELSATPGELALQNVRGDVLGTAFSAALRYRSGDRARFELNFDSDRLDVERLLGGAATYGALRDWFVASSHADAKADEPQATGWLDRVDAHIDVRIGAMRLPAIGEIGAEARLRLSEGTLDVQRLDLHAASGLDVTAAGRLANIAGQPEGRLKVSLAAADAAAVDGLARFMEVSQRMLPPARLRALAPVKLDATIESLPDGGRGLRSEIVGRLGHSGAGVNLTLRGDATAPRSAELTVNATLANGDGKVLLMQLFPRLGDSELARFSAERGKLEFNARGVPQTGLVTQARLTAGGLDFAFEGDVVLADEDVVDLAGAARLQGVSIASGLALAGISASDEAAANAFDLSGHIEKNGTRYAWTGIAGKVAGEQLSGAVQLDLGGAKPVVSADLRLEAASLPHLFGPLVAWDQGVGADAVLADFTAGGEAYWTDRKFNAELLDAVTGRVRIQAQELQLVDGVALTDASLDVRLTDAAIEVDSLKGTVLGGTFAAAAKLSKRGAGVGLTAEMEVKELPLEHLAPSDKAGFARGSAELEVSVVGEGLTPRGLAAGLTGNGKLVLGAGTISGLAPDVLAPFDEPRTQAEAAQLDEEALARRLAARLQQSTFAYPATTVPIRIRNGTARFERVAVGGEGGEVAVSAYVDLARLRLDSEWVLVAGRTGANEVAPQATLAFAGSLFDFGRLEPRIDVQELQRYITMRRMERDVKQLEELDVTPRGVRPVPRASAETRSAPPSRQQAPNATAASPPGQPDLSDTAPGPQTAPQQPLEATAPTDGGPPSTAAADAAAAAPIGATTPRAASPQQSEPEILPWHAQPQPAPPVDAGPNPVPRTPRAATSTPWTVEVLRGPN